MRTTAVASPLFGNERDLGHWGRALVPVLGLHGAGIAAAALCTGAHPLAPPPEQPIVVELAPLASAEEPVPAAAAAAAAAAASPAAAPPAQSQPKPATPAPTLLSQITPPLPVAALTVPRATAVVPAPAAPPSLAPSPRAPATGKAGASGKGTPGALTSGATGAAFARSGEAGAIGGRGHAASTGDAGAVWRGRLQRHVDRLKSYPAAAKLMKREGRVVLTLTIDRQGHVLKVSVAQGTGFKPIDSEALATIRRADPLPSPPGELSGDTIPISLPIGFYQPK